MLRRRVPDGDEYVADDLGFSNRWRPQLGKLGPRQGSIGTEMGIVNLDLAAVEPEQDAVMSQVGLAVEPVIQDHSSVGAQELSDQFGGPFCLERDGCEALLASIQRKPMASRDLDSRADLFGNTLPEVVLFA